MAAIGALLALGGAGYYVGKGIQKNAEQQKVASEGTWRNKYTENSLSLSDPSHISYDQNQPVVKVQKGKYGLPRTYYQQPGTGAYIRAYGRPDQNIMTNL